LRAFGEDLHHVATDGEAGGDAVHHAAGGGHVAA
jgi:hypothetical protein